MEFNIDDLVKHLTLEEKVSLLSGADAWHTRAIQRELPGAPEGIPAIRMTDGPHGVRRPYEDDNGSIPSNSFPTASAVAATWNVDLVHKVGQALAVDTKSKGCDILLGPAVNIHRAPLCGRNFEYYSEDPYLAGRLAVAYIQGLQSRGVGASIKHYAANNAEFERFTISSNLDERTLREIYLPAFEMAVMEADPWTVMCSYNKINGTWASENPYLLTDILKKEWGFKGFVVSDWGAVHHRIRSTNAGMDLEMPGLGEMPIKIVVDAVRRGLVAESTVDEAVRRILRVVWMARKDDQAPQLQPDGTDTPENRALAREVAGEAIVLLKNEGAVLPINTAKVRSIAVFGPNAAVARIQGGGSAHVNPHYTVSPLEGIRRRAGEAIRVEYSQGCKNNITPPVLDAESTRLPASDEKGFQAAYYANPDFAGEPVAVRAEPVLHFSMTGLPADLLKGKAISVRWQADFTAPVSGEYTFGLSSFGQSRLLIDDQVVTDHWTDPDLPAFMAVWPWRSKFGKTQLQQGKVYRLVVEYVSLPGRARLNASCDMPLPADELDRVSRLAAAADMAVVCAGTTWEHETEGHDRLEWELPGEQANLIRTVQRANPNTVVVLTNGSPLDLSSWIAKVPAVLEAWFNGQETGNAIADVLFGDVNPSGKLPDTYPVHYEDNPSFINYPGENGNLTYGEGLFVGYRYYDMKNLEPLFPFGFGLSYTTFAYENLRLSAAEVDPGNLISVSVDVRNTGTRAGKETVQLYVRDIESRLVRPPKELKGFQKVFLAPGEVKTLTFTLAPRDLSYYDPALKDWVAEPGVFEVLMGSSSRDIRAAGKFALRGEAPAPRPRLNPDTVMSHILQDPRGRAVLERHLPELVAGPDLERYADRFTLRRMAMVFMEILPPERLDAIAAELAQIE